MTPLNVQKKVDADLRNATTYLDLKAMGAASGSEYPKFVKAIILGDSEATSGSTHARINLQLTGNNRREVLRLLTGKIHYLSVDRIYVEHTDVDGLIVLGTQ